MSADTPRIAPGGFSELGPVNWVICRIVARAVKAPDAHIFSTLGRQRKLFRAWLRFAGQMMPGGTINRHETELVILRVAHLRKCQYELDHHSRIAPRVGIGPDVLERIFQGPDASGFSDRHRALLGAVDSLVQNKNIDDATWSEVSAHFSEAQLVELCLLVGHYEMLATTIATLRVARDF
jgi:AhpD family alkylhydroperoxidase